MPKKTSYTVRIPMPDQYRSPKPVKVSHYGNGYDGSNVKPANQPKSQPSKSK